MDAQQQAPSRISRDGGSRPQQQNPSSQTQSSAPKRSVTQAAAKKLHLPGHERRQSKDIKDTPHSTSDESSQPNGAQPQRHRLKRGATHIAHPKGMVRHTGHAIADFAKATTGSGSNSGPRVAPAAETGQPPIDIPQVRPVNPADVLAERQRRSRRDDELRETLSSLQDLASHSTRDLDDTYYGLLEKAGSLREVLGMLQELTGRVDTAIQEFEGDAEELQTEIREQVGTFGGFKEHQKKVDEMEERIAKGKEKAAKLSERLEVARKRVDDWDRKEAEWQAQTSKNIRIGWASLIGAAVLVLLIFGLRTAWDVKKNAGPDVNVFRETFSKVSDAFKFERVRVEVDDGPLRIFDEL